MTQLLQSLGAEVASAAGRPGAGALQPFDHQLHGRLRHRPQDARLDPGAWADAGARRPCGRLAARRLRHRRAARRPAPQGAGGDGRRARPARRLCPRQGARRAAEGRGRRVSLRLGRARPKTR